MASASTFVQEKAAPPALTPMPDNSVTPCMSLVLSQLLPYCWCSVSTVEGPLIGMSGTLEAFCFTQPRSLLVSQPEIMRTSHPNMEPGMGSWCGAQCGGSVAEDPFLGGSSAFEILLPVFNHHMWVQGQPVLNLHPSYQSPQWLLLYTLSNRTYVQLDFRHFSIWLFHNLEFSNNFDVVQEGGNTTFIYIAILMGKKSPFLEGSFSLSKILS